jgi:hypothetical protein
VVRYNELLRQRERDYKQRQKLNYDRRHRATNLEKLEPNVNVYVKDQKIWGKVKQDSNTPRSYYKSNLVGGFEILPERVI